MVIYILNRLSHLGVNQKQDTAIKSQDIGWYTLFFS
jgi:hypothetical protein